MSNCPMAAPNESTSQTTRELLIGLPPLSAACDDDDDDDDQVLMHDDDNDEEDELQPHGFVDIYPTSTLADVRQTILQEFDDDLLPSHGFYFLLRGNKRVMPKQEARIQVWDLATDVVTVELRSVLVKKKKKKKKRKSDEFLLHQDESPKRTRVSHEEKSDHNSKDANARNHEEKSITSFKEQNSLTEKKAVCGKEKRKKMSQRDLNAMPEDGYDAKQRSMDNVTKENNDSRSLATKKTSADDESLLDSEDDRLLFDSETTSQKSTATKSDSFFPDDDLSLLDKKQPALENNTEAMEFDELNTENSNTTQESKADDPIEVVGVKNANDPHFVHNQALKQSCSILQGLDTLLKENPLFCSEDRRAQFADQIRINLAKPAPSTIVGVLGSTGVGKSSLLNALLDEASVLPTSGSRGCTAAVVELRYNTALIEPAEPVPVYKGEVEFIKLQEWRDELKILVEECSTLDSKTIYARTPDEANQSDAAAAWSKINQVYGRETMERYHGQRMDRVYQILSTNKRVVDLLTSDNNQAYKSILVQEGVVDKGQASMLTRAFADIPARMRRTKKKWAASFRSKINSYVYRSGNGSVPQTWPLIRKVTLEGPWQVLSTGACLVDLPGVRDANAARAKVAETYLQNCNRIWVCAPIRRAVDDGTAKELLGEQFKRRLLMDGQYGNVSFICTQTDDCEPTEIMRDHQDVAMNEPGRWEKMAAVRDELGEIEKSLLDLESKEEDLKLEFAEAKEEALQCRKDYLEAKKEAQEYGDDAEPVDVETMKHLETIAKEARANANKAKERFNLWKTDNADKMEQMKGSIRTKQRLLKSICAAVRNEYSKACLQEDFRAGLKELYQSAEEDRESNNQEMPNKLPLPDNFAMDVYCISSNDYLKLTGIKPSSDGPPNTFLSAASTQIPSLRSFVHETTANFRVSYTESFVNEVSDLLDRVKLLATDTDSGVSGSRTGRRCQAIFAEEVKKLAAGVAKEAKDFQEVATRKIESSLHPALKTGAAKGRDAALYTVRSWGSTSRRTKHERSQEQNGLHFSTYFATVRRSGAYTSKTVGEIDFNAELCEPMEKEFGNNWQETMDASFRVFLANCEQKIFNLCAQVDRALVSGLAQTGMDVARLRTIATTANRTYTTAVKTAFGVMRTFTTNTQRNLNRSLLPLVKAGMQQGYEATLVVPGGTGKFSRMKTAIETHSGGAVVSMFDESTNVLCSEISKMIDRLSVMVNQVSAVIQNCLEGVYSICWDDQSGKSALVGPEMLEKIRACRDKLLPDLNRLRNAQDETMNLVGIEREALDLEVMNVESLDERIDNKFQQAQERGDVIDLCDSSDEGGNDSKPAASTYSVPPAARKVKAEPIGRGRGVPTAPHV